MLEKLPDDVKKVRRRSCSPAVDRKVYNIVHLIYRADNTRAIQRITSFRAEMEEHWRAGYHDARRTLGHREVLQRPTNHEGVFTFDLAVDGRE